MSCPQNFNRQSKHSDQDIQALMEDILNDCNDPKSIQLFVDDIIKDMEAMETRRRNLYQNFENCNLCNLNSSRLNDACNSSLNSLHLPQQAENCSNCKCIENCKMKQRKISKPVLKQRERQPMQEDTSKYVQQPKEYDGLCSEKYYERRQVSQPMLLKLQISTQLRNHLQNNEQ